MSGPKLQPAANDTGDFWIQYLVDDHICSTLHRNLELFEDEGEQINDARAILDTELKYAERLVSAVKGLLADLDEDPSAFVREHRH